MKFVKKILRVISCGFFPFSPGGGGGGGSGAKGSFDSINYLQEITPCTEVQYFFLI